MNIIFRKLLFTYFLYPIMYVFIRFISLFVPKRRFCPCCGWQGYKFLPEKYSFRLEAECPKCNSLERHRLAILYLKKENVSGKVLHFAPELSIRRFFNSLPNIEYFPIDLIKKKDTLVGDITDLNFESDYFNLIYCSHVLEHILNVEKAYSELHRVLSKNGKCLIQVPIRDKWLGKKLSKTYEDKSIVSRSKRLIHFGNEDHFRVYSTDFKNILEKYGFEVEVIKAEDFLSESEIRKYGVIPVLDPLNSVEGWIYSIKKVS